ncbi:MAG: ParB N-terminal domain-containing protein, partial [Synergistaceae bacterium]|nr:ParB N-terminal domain-containing protein [Synergistaceae bacterium]
MKETENHVIEYLSPLELKPYDKNARKHSERQINALISSVEKFGFTLPLLIDKDCGVIAGHARLEAAIQLRFTRVPCIRLSRFTEEQRAAYIIADNKLGELSEWDEEILRSELLRLKDMGLELITLGFSEKEIDSLSLGGEFERDAAEDALPELSEEAVTQAGDLWLLGEHRLICGDSTDARIVERLLDMVTDPPYGVNYDPKWREAAHHGGRLKNGLVMNDDRSDWREAWSLFAG